MGKVGTTNQSDVTQKEKKTLKTNDYALFHPKKTLI